MSVDNNCGQLGVIGNILCPRCGGHTYKNEAGANICTNRECKFWFYSFTPPPQLEKESLPDAGVTSVVETLTSSRQYITGLRQTLGYTSDRQIYRLRQRLGDIQIEEDSLGIILTFRPAGGHQRFPLIPGTQEVETNIKLADINFNVVHPHIDGNIGAQCSGNPVFAKCYLKD